MIQQLMVLYEFILLGIIQGVTEPLPISSSGHLVILRHLFQVKTPGLSFEVIVHLGSLIAIILVYRRDIFILCKESISYCITRKDSFKESFHYSWMILIATFITGGIGLVIESFIQDSLQTPFIIGIAFIVTSFFLWLIRHLDGNKSSQDITLKIAILIGLAQACALLPGISRSGATIVGAMLLGLSRKTALQFSFLLFIPVGIGVNLMSYKEIGNVLTSSLAVPYVIAFLAALLSTFYALKLFIRLMLRGKLIIFSLYCLLIGLFVIIFMH